MKLLLRRTRVQFVQYATIACKEIIRNLVVGQAAFTCCNHIKKVWQHQIGCNMFL